jgi:hypothetical protein
LEESAPIPSAMEELFDRNKQDIKDLLDAGLKRVIKETEKLSRENPSTSNTYPSKAEIDKFAI